MFSVHPSLQLSRLSLISPNCIIIHHWRILNSIDLLHSLNRFDIHELASLICMHQTYAAPLLCYSTWITAVSLVFYISAPMTERSVPCVLCIVSCGTTPLGLWVCWLFVSVRRAQWGICPQPFAISCWLACSDCHRNGVLKRGGGSFCLGAAEHKHHRRRERGKVGEGRHKYWWVHKCWTFLE